MKIISSGNNTTTYRFHCAQCGCVYEVAEWELQYSDELAFPRFRYTHCPRCKELIPTDYAEIVHSTDTLTETISESNDESKSEPTETCDRYKSETTNIIEQSELTKLRVSVEFLQEYCENKHNCKGCPFDAGEKCGLERLPKNWNTDF